MRWPKLENLHYLTNPLFDVLAIIFLFLGAVLTIGSLIAISITSGILAILLLGAKGSAAWTPLFKALGVEALVLVIAAPMWFAGIQLAWRHG
jgi:hypothetical protein